LYSIDAAAGDTTYSSRERVWDGWKTGMVLMLIIISTKVNVVNIGGD